MLVTIGILYVYLLALYDSYLIISHGVTALMLMYLCSLLFVPESPVYLMSKNRRADAEKCLRRLRGADYDVQVELKQIKAALEDAAKQKISFEVITRRANLKGLLYSSLLLVNLLQIIKVFVKFKFFPKLCFKIFL